MGPQGRPQVRPWRVLPGGAAAPHLTHPRLVGGAQGRAHIRGGELCCTCTSPHVGFSGSMVSTVSLGKPALVCWKLVRDTVSAFHGITSNKVTIKNNCDILK